MKRKRRQTKKPKPLRTIYGTWIEPISYMHNGHGNNTYVWVWAGADNAQGKFKTYMQIESVNGGLEAVKTYFDKLPED